MQVTHVEDHVTHAVIGAKEVINFGISNSSEFFNILSSSLYKDQFLAVAREVLCNAWDAHIAAGCTDTPIEVTLTSSHLIVRDFGHAIAHEDIGPIYGTYGNSTKKNDGTQTGGFGLGCKAPFAYTDHFEVVSNHKGVRTIYNMSRSSAQVGGMPGIMPLATLPTNETGLSVSIGMKTNADVARFRELIALIAFNGEMSVKLNGVMLPKMGFDPERHKYFVRLSVCCTPAIYVRYGNVLYPVDKCAEIADLYKKVRIAIQMVDRGGNRASLILQADPHTISVTPSRESLSMQEHTIKSLNALFQKFLDDLLPTFDECCKQVLIDKVQQAYVDKNYASLLIQDLNHVAKLEFGEQRLLSLTSVYDMAAAHMAQTTDIPTKQMLMTIKQRLDLLVGGQHINRGDAASLMASIKKPAKHGPSWVMRRVIAPLAVKMQGTSLDFSKLMVSDSNHRWLGWTNHKGMHALVLASKLHPSSNERCLSYLRRIVVLTSNIREMMNRAERHDIAVQYGLNTGFLVYHVSLKKEHREAARKFFTENNFRLIDLTVRQPWEAPLASATELPKVAKPQVTRPKGLPLLSNILGTFNRIDGSRAHHHSAVRTDTPEFVFYLPRKDYSSTIPRFNGDESRTIIKLFGLRGAIVSTQKQLETWLAKPGVERLVPFLIKEATAYLKQSKSLQEYFTVAPDRMIEMLSAKSVYNDVHKQAINTCTGHPALRDKFGIKYTLTPQDELYLKLIELLELEQEALLKSASELPKLARDIPLTKQALKLIERVENAKYLNLVDWSELDDAFQDDPAELAHNPAFKILLTALTPHKEKP